MSTHFSDTGLALIQWRIAYTKHCLHFLLAALLAREIGLAMQKRLKILKYIFAHFDWIECVKIEMAALNLSSFWDSSDTKCTLSSSIPADVGSRECILGIDQAGRGPVLGDVILLHNIT